MSRDKGVRVPSGNGACPPAKALEFGSPRISKRSPRPPWRRICNSASTRWNAPVSASAGDGCLRTRI